MNLVVSCKKGNLQNITNVRIFYKSVNLKAYMRIEAHIQIWRLQPAYELL